MTIAIAVILFLNAAFNLVAWPTFFRRVLRDPRSRDATGKATRFLRVHEVIFVIALVLAMLSIIAGTIVLASGFVGFVAENFKEDMG